MVHVSAIISAIVAFIVALLVPVLNSRRLHQAWVREQLAERTDAFYTVAQDVDRILQVEAKKEAMYFTGPDEHPDLSKLSVDLYYAVDRLKLYASKELSDKADALAEQLSSYDEARQAVSAGMGKHEWSDMGADNLMKSYRNNYLAKAAELRAAIRQELKIEDTKVK